MVSVNPTVENVGFKGQFEMSHQEALATVTAKATQAQAHMELQTGCSYHSTDLSPVTQYELLVPNSTPEAQQPLLAPEKDACKRREDHNNSFDDGLKSAYTMAKTPTIDGYNWRKYGQKQVKSSKSFRSYYKCTNLDCHAKKVQHCDHSSCVIEIVYKGQHNHDPPRKIRRTRGRRFVSCAGPAVGSDTLNRPIQKLHGSDSSKCKIECRQESLLISELEGQNSSDSDGNVGIKVEEENGDELEPKKRIEPQKPMLMPLKWKRLRPSSSDEISGIEAEHKHGDEQMLKPRMEERVAAYSAPIYKTVKESKIVVHAAGDAGISSDGYRWRKYGQKMVKGTPHPRSYYRCTSAGCPVRKHVERAKDNTTTIIITYEGKHDHDMPVPKKRRGPPSTALLIAAAAAMNNEPFNNTEALPQQTSSNQWTVEKEGDLTGERALELGGEKALESARTLLSIGIELKSH
nr:WRKY [Loropetalum chinense var. rubrum]